MKELTAILAFLTMLTSCEKPQTISTELPDIYSPVSVTEPETSLPKETDYDRAKSVYEYMQENGSGTCVNYACQTYEKCSEVGLDCALVWTDAGICGHVANIVNVDGVWYVLDTQGGCFLDYNYCFTEVIDTDGNHIADSSIISNQSYDELHNKAKE